MAKRKMRKGRLGPQFICDRTGMKHPMVEGVFEEGTGWFVHFSVTDGRFSLTEHPQAKPIILDGDDQILPFATGEQIDNSDHDNPDD